jgi:hypothetical protein
VHDLIVAADERIVNIEFWFLVPTSGVLTYGTGVSVDSGVTTDE